jgi:monoamine oxidase
MVKPLVFGRAPRMVVLGAGMAGLVAAVALQDAGLEPLVLEADVEVGGRIRTHRFAPPHRHAYGELGAMRIPAGHSRALALIDRLGLSGRVIPFPAIFTDPANLIDLHGAVRTARQALAAARDTPDLAVDRLGMFLDAVAPRALGALFHRVAAPALRARLLAPGGYWHTGTEPLGGLRQLLSWVAANHEPALGPVLTAAVDELMIELGPAHTVAGGLDQLPRRLAALLPGRIRLRHWVDGLSDSAHGVDIEVTAPPPAQAGAHVTSRLQADYAVCAIPPAVLSTLDLTGLPSQTADRFSNHTSSAASKTLLHAREPFWSREGVHTGGSAGELIRQVFYPPPALAAGRRCTCAVITASYTIDGDTAPLIALPEPQRTNTVIDALARMHPGILEPGMIIGHSTMDWHRHPYSLGAFDGDWMPTADADRLHPATDHIIFASDTYSPHPGWIEGAVHSGQQAAMALLQRINR